jgi:hypothetical protein
LKLAFGELLLVLLDEEPVRRRPLRLFAPGLVNDVNHDEQQEAAKNTRGPYAIDGVIMTHIKVCGVMVILPHVELLKSGMLSRVFLDIVDIQFT